MLLFLILFTIVFILLCTCILLLLLLYWYLLYCYSYLLWLLAFILIPTISLVAPIIVLFLLLPVFNSSTLKSPSTFHFNMHLSLMPVVYTIFLSALYSIWYTYEQCPGYVLPIYISYFSGLFSSIWSYSRQADCTMCRSPLIDPSIR